MALSSLAPVNDWKGNAYPLQQETENKVVLVVNVASQCGFTVQYDALEKLYKKYKDSGLIIIGIPSNEFKQEKGTGESCRLRFGVTFPILEKSAVNGHDANPLIKYCKQQAPHLILGPGIIWNFEKFLLNRKGEVVARFPGFLQPSFLEGYVRRELGLSTMSPITTTLKELLIFFVHFIMFGIIATMETVRGNRDYLPRFFQN